MREALRRIFVAKGIASPRNVFTKTKPPYRDQAAPQKANDGEKLCRRDADRGIL